MATFVLVHGAWHGGWCWQPVAARLEAKGHTVYRPTLTGLGDRAHLLSRDVGLATHIQDIVSMLRFEDLHDAVLVGHSYAGMVITGVAAETPERIARLVYYDAFLPDDGDSALDLLPPHIAEHFVAQAQAEGGGWLMPRRPLEKLGVRDPEAGAWLSRRFVDHPLATYAEKLRLPSGAPQVPSDYISCTRWAQVFAPQAEKARLLGWPVQEIEADHEALATAPDLLADALLATVDPSRRAMTREAA
jgi:pimeloyl-ACP methyl ester carboxylesterase